MVNNSSTDFICKTSEHNFAKTSFSRTYLLHMMLVDCNGFVCRGRRTCWYWRIDLVVYKQRRVTSRWSFTRGDQSGPRAVLSGVILGTCLSEWPLDRWYQHLTPWPLCHSTFARWCWRCNAKACQRDYLPMQLITRR